MKLLVADDHALFREALVLYIERAVPSVAVSLAKDFSEALAIMQKNPDQDLILLDLKMPGMNGMKGLVEMRQTYPGARVALMSGMAEPEDVRAAMDLGVVGYFPKTLSGKALLKGIKNVLDGQIFLPRDENLDSIMPAYYGDSVQSVNKNEVSEMTKDTSISAVNFTAREKDVLVYLAQGQSNKEIANILGLQVVTIKLHVRGICRKLNTKNRTQAALLARDFI